MYRENPNIPPVFVCCVSKIQSCLTEYKYTNGICKPFFKLQKLVNVCNVPARNQKVRFLCLVGEGEIVNQKSKQIISHDHICDSDDDFPRLRIKENSRQSGKNAEEIARRWPFLYVVDSQTCISVHLY